MITQQAKDDEKWEGEKKQEFQDSGDGLSRRNR